MNKIDNDIISSISKNRNNYSLDRAIKILENLPITERHIDIIIDTCSRVVELKIQQGIIDSQVSNNIQMLVSKFQNDSKRCENAISILKEFEYKLPDELIGELVVLAIKVQLGVSSKNDH